MSKLQKKKTYKYQVKVFEKNFQTQNNNEFTLLDTSNTNLVDTFIYKLTENNKLIVLSQLSQFSNEQNQNGIFLFSSDMNKKYLKSRN